MRLLFKMVTGFVVIAGVTVMLLVAAPFVLSEVVSNLRAEGQDARGRELTVLAGRGSAIGVSVRDVEQAEASSERATGVLVEDVRPDSPADKAGLRPSDIIVEFDGEHVRSARQFTRLVQETPAGRTVKAAIMRGGQRRDVEITPASRRSADLLIDGDRIRERLGDLGTLADRLPPFNFNFDFGGPFDSGRRLGVTVNELTRQLADYFGASDGVLITSVTDGSAAARAGLQAGDVIVSLNGAPVRSREDLARAIREAADDRSQSVDVTVGYVREKRERTATATLEAPRRPARERARH
jgi:serine protease Do